MDLAYRVLFILFLPICIYVLSLLRQGFKHYSAYIGQLSVLVTHNLDACKRLWRGTTLLVALIGTFILVILPIIFGGI